MAEKQNRVSSLISEHYRQTFRLHGASYAGVDWPKEADAQLRYRLIGRALAGRPGTTLLDAGCGVGLFYEFLAGEPSLDHLRAGYRGFDILPEMVEAAKLRHREVDFRIASVENGLPAELESDFVVANGLFTVKGAVSQSEMLSFVDSALESLWAVCRSVLVFNLMTDLVDYRYDRLLYLHPAEVIARYEPRFGRRFAVFHDSRLFDAFYLWAREPAGVWS